MKIVNECFVFDQDDAPMLVNALAFTHCEYSKSVMDPANIKMAKDDPKYKRRMLNTIKSLLDIDNVLRDICDKGRWPKGTLDPMYILLRASMPKDALSSPEAFFDTLVATSEHRENGTAAKKE